MSLTTFAAATSLALSSLALSSGAALATGGCYAISPPHPRFTQAEVAASGDPLAWVGHLFQGSSQNRATASSPRVPVDPGPAATAHSR